jgi:alanyl-tRNA synthetase
MPPEPAEFSAVITDIRLESRDAAAVRWRMTLDRTQFAPGDTGTLHAVSRTGTRIQIPVLAVIDEAGDTWHIVEKPLAAGTDVTGRITVANNQQLTTNNQQLP